MKDMFNKEIELGHIVAVRYVWNSYIGVVRLQGLSLHEFADRHKGAAPYHSIKDNATYQILGHVDKKHKDYKQNVYDYMKSETMKCPFEICVYYDKVELRKMKLRKLN